MESASRSQITVPIIYLTLLISRLLEFAFNYFDLKSFPDGETKRALQRIVNKSRGGIHIQGNEGTNMGSGSARDVREEEVEQRSKKSGKTYIKGNEGTSMGSGSARDVKEVEQRNKKSGWTYITGNEGTNTVSGGIRDVREEEIEQRDKKKRKVIG